MKATTRIALAALVATALCAWPTQPSLHAEEIPAPKTIPTSEHAWTLEEALKELKLHPRDPYLQYVALQLARRAGKVEEVAGQLPAANGRSDRSNQVDLFGMFAGALAVQESLQLDTMRGGQGGSGPQASAPAVAPEPYVEVTETCYKTVAKTCYKEDRFQVANFDGTTTEVVKRVPYTVTEQVPYTVTKRVPASKINRSAAEELASEPELAPMPREVPSENDDSDSPPAPSASDAQLPPKCHMDRSPFYLPVIIDDSVRAKLREILLYVKDDPSKPWTLADKGQSSEKVFSFRPEHEGEYWFTVVTVDKMGRQTPPDLTREDPSIIVVYERKPRSEGSSEVEPELVPMPREVEPETPTNNYYEVPPPIVPNVSPLGCLPGNASPFVFSEALLWRAPAARTQIRFTAPAGMKVNWSTVAADGKPSFSKIPVEAPGRYNFQQGAIYRLKLSGIEGRPGLEVYPTLEVVPSNPKTEEFLAHSSVPIDFTHEDFEHVAQGNYLVKVSYLPNQEGLESPTAGVGEVVSTRLQPGTDPIKEAQRRGSILLVVRLGNINEELTAPAAKTSPSVALPAAALAQLHYKSPSLAAETVPGTAVTRMTAVIAEEVPAPKEDTTDPAQPPPAASPVAENETAPQPIFTPDSPEDTAKTEREQKEAAEARRHEIVDISTLKGPTIKSHPWKKMLGKKNPAVSHLSCCVPADFYFVEFHSLTKLMELMDTADQWGTFIYSQSVHDARSQKVGDRIQQQLAVESNPLLRPFYDLVVEDIAITGSDLFIREGSDVTLLFRYKQEKLFKDRMDKFLTNAAKAHADAHKTKGRLLGVDYVHLATPDRAVSVYSCYPEPGLHVRSNSKVALKRVLEAIQGKTAGGKNVRRLGNTAEFKYIRTLMPKGASEEDGFIYLSDPFVRHMVGPRLKLTERRRLLAYNHLRMIGHAAQMYRTEFGKAPGSLDEIAAAGCSPGKFNEGELNAPLTSPYARGYELSADGTRGICSRYGTTHFLTPCCEIPVCQITGEEADLYDAFLKDYEQYWRTYFDPIAIRVQVTGKRLRLETIVLPLIDSTVYTTLAKVLGGEPEHLDTLPVPKRNLFSVNVRLNREGWLKEMLVKEDNVTSLKLTQLLAGDEGEVASLAGTLLASSLQEPVVLAPVGLLVGTLQAEKFGIFFDAISETSGLSELAIHAPRFLLKGVGTQVGLHVYDQDVPFDLNLASFLGQMMGTFNNGGRSEAGLANLGMMAIAVPVAGLTAPGYISVTVQDEKIVDDFLNRVDKVLPPLLRQYLGESGPLPVEPDFYKVALKGGTTARSATIRFGPAKFRVHWARIGKGLYLANQLAVLEDLEAADAKLTADRDRGPKAHAMVRMRPQNWDQALPGFTLSWAENNRQACQHNLGPLSSVARALSAVPPGEQAKTGSWDDRSRRVLEHAERVYGTRCSCPDGGRYIVSEDGKTVKCSVHGSILEPRQGSAPAANSATARLMRDFADLTAALTFTKDGLRAVITIDRK